MDLHTIAPQGLPDLHAHLTSSVPASFYWKTAHANGFKLPYKTYFSFLEGITISPDRRRNLKDYLDHVYHPLLNKLSSGSPEVEETTYESIAGAYRHGITVMELRLNPMKHNRGGEVDLDHMILSCLRGMERALVEYPSLRAGIIFCMDRQFSKKNNNIIVQKAIRYKARGVVGIDFANYGSAHFRYNDYTTIVQEAKDAGLFVTAHTGETADTDDIIECIHAIKPHRIGHGISAAYSPEALRLIREHRITLELCPIGNLATDAIRDIAELKHIVRTFIDAQIPFCLNTDWPETVEKNRIADVYHLLLKHDIITPEEAIQIVKHGHASTFIPCMSDTNLYL
jgi:adenosine deaminase